VSKVSASVRLEQHDFERASLVALVDRRSVSEIIAECVRRALPALEEELQRPRLTPDMKRRIDAGEDVAQVLAARLAPYSIGPQEAAALNDRPLPKPTTKASK
jgi:hypothetical protein